MAGYFGWVSAFYIMQNVTEKQQLAPGAIKVASLRNAEPHFRAGFRWNGPSFGAP